MADISKLTITINWIPMQTNNPFAPTQSYTGGYYQARFLENVAGGFGIIGTSSTSYAGALSGLLLAATSSGNYQYDSNINSRTW